MCVTVESLSCILETNIVYQLYFNNFFFKTCTSKKGEGLIYTSIKINLKKKTQKNKTGKVSSISAP